MFEDKDLLSIQEVRSKVEKAYAAWQNTGKCKDVSGTRTRTIRAKKSAGTPHLRGTPAFRMASGLRIEGSLPGPFRKSSSSGRGLRPKFNMYFPNRLMCSVENGLKLASTSSPTEC